MSQIKEDAHRQGLMLDSPDELYKWFTAQVYFVYNLFFCGYSIIFIVSSLTRSGNAESSRSIYDESLR